MSSIRLTQKSGLSAKSYRLSHADVEKQVMQDLAKYKSLCAGVGITVDPHQPLDVDHFVEMVFGIVTDPTPIPQQAGEELLGFYNPVEKKIVYDPELCGHPGKILFTVAHEAGHVSLHTCLVAGASQKKWQDLHKHAHIEWQANAYAAFLLSPTPLVMDLLNEEGYVEFGTIGTVDMIQFAPKMSDRFGLSWQAAEIRLERMNITLANKKYQYT